MTAGRIARPRDFPSIEQLLQAAELSEVIKAVPRPAAAEIAREIIARAKMQLREEGKEITGEELLRQVKKAIRDLKRTEITPVINAAGILVHTNLGRAPLPERLFEEVKKVVTGYSNVEFDLKRGVRGKRGQACERYLALLAEAEAATVVNNCAAAIFLILNTHARGRFVVISRGELVQIGGGFRIPDILKRSGARLAEVGTTNVTSLEDYRNAIEKRTALILKVHKSNFRQSGFIDEVSLKDLVMLGREQGVPVINDLGSGVFVSTRSLLGYEEPTVQQSVRTGADLTCFSGDKMLGGSQAGLIAGRAEMVARIKKNPLYRTVRADKITYAILERLLSTYLNGAYGDEIRLWSLLQVPRSELNRRARAILKDLGNPEGVGVISTEAFVGGGALPESAIGSAGFVFSTHHRATALMKRFREWDPPVIGRIEGDQFILDLRSVSEKDLPVLATAIGSVLSLHGEAGR